MQLEVRRYWRGSHLQQFTQFVTVGASGVVVDFGLYLLLTRGFAFWHVHYLAANAVSFTVANINNFWWNRVWTFQATAGRIARQYPRFLAASLVYLAVTQGVVWVLVGIFGWYDLAAKAVALALAVGVYFIAVRRTVFHEPAATG